MRNVSTKWKRLRQTSLVIATAVAALAGLSVINPTPANAAVEYMYKDVATGRCLDSNIEGYVYTGPCNSSNNYMRWYQSWGQVPGTVVLQNKATGLCLYDYATWGIYTNKCSPRTPYREWFISHDANGYVFKHSTTKLCLDSNANGDAYSHACGGVSNKYQHWVR